MTAALPGGDAARSRGTLAAAIARLASTERIRAYTRLMLVITLGGGAVQAALGPGLLDSFGHVIGGDFIAFFTGARFFVEGRLGELYSLESQRAFQASVTFPHVPRGIHPFINPPYAIALYLPYASFSYPIGLALWWLTGLGALAASALLLRNELRGLRRHRTLTLCLGAFLFFPTVSWLLYGQITPVTLLLYAATFALLRRGRDFAAGAVLGCLAYKPQLALTLALVLVVKGRVRAIAGGAVALASWTTLGLLLAPAAMIEYVRIGPRIFSLLRWEEYPRWGIHSFLGFSSLLFDGVSHPLAGALAVVLSAATLAVLLRYWWRRPWEPGSRGWDLAMSGTIALGLIISPHLFVYDLMLLLLPFAVLLHHHAPSAGDALLPQPVFAWTVLLWMAAFLGSYLSLAQLEITRILGLPLIAFQASTVIALGWGVALLRLSDDRLPPTRSPALP